MAPVAALIVVRPCIEVNAIESDSLNADAEGEHARPHFAVEAVLVHAEIGGASRKRMKRGGATACACDVWFRSPRDELSLMAHASTPGEHCQLEYRGNFG
jgi:hypothetical protein